MARESNKDPETLRDRLVKAALEILSAEGIEGLTLRSVARRAGVSHGAPARHFRSLSDLRAEVAAVGYRSLSESIEKACAQIQAAPSPDGPLEGGPFPRLAAAGRAYLDCALANPGLFALMFRPGDLDFENASLARDSQSAFNQLHEQVRIAQSAGWKSTHPSRLVAGALWASIHGLATLWVQGAYQGVNPNVSIDQAVATSFAMSAPDPVSLTDKENEHE